MARIKRMIGADGRIIGAGGMLRMYQNRFACDW